jgi:hypothetical protein
MLTLTPAHLEDRYDPRKVQIGRRHRLAVELLYPRVTSRII